MKRLRDEKEKSSGSESKVFLLKLDSNVIRLIALYLTLQEVNVFLLLSKTVKLIIDRDLFWKQYLPVMRFHTLESEEKLFLRGCAQKMYLLFNEKAYESYLNNLYATKNIKLDSIEPDQIRDDFLKDAGKFLHEIPTHLKIDFIKEFFDQYPEFDIINATTLDCGDSLPILLYDWGQTDMLEYTLNRFPEYDKNTFYSENSLSEISKKPPIYQQKIAPKEKEQKNAVSSLIPAGSFKLSARNIIKAQSYAKKLYNCFDEKYVTEKIEEEKRKSPNSNIDEIKDKIFWEMENYIPSNNPEDMQVLMVNEFFWLYPDFNIEDCSVSISKNRLPHLLAANGQIAALNHLQKIKPFDMNDRSETGFSVQDILDQINSLNGQEIEEEDEEEDQESWNLQQFR